MSHLGSSKFARDDDWNDNYQPSPELQRPPSAPSDVGTRRASPTSETRLMAGTGSIAPLPTTSALVYVLPLSTSIPILNFPPSITAPPSPSYIPTYTVLPDGSLLTPLFTNDLAISNARLFGGSALLTLFIINIWIAITFLRRAQLSSIKDKTLFYLLIASQVMGPVAFTSLLVPFISRSANCTVYVEPSSRFTSHINKHPQQRQHNCVHRY